MEIRQQFLQDNKGKQCRVSTIDKPTIEGTLIEFDDDVVIIQRENIGIPKRTLISQSQIVSISEN